MPTKIYRVGVKVGETLTEHLVRATGKQPALNHITQGMVICEVAGQEDLMRLAQGGTKLQDATQAATPKTSTVAPKAAPKK